MMLSFEKPFALLHRPHITGSKQLEMIKGEICQPTTISSIPLCNSSKDQQSSNHYSSLVLIPYCQLQEQNYECIDDDSKLISLLINDYQRLPMSEVFKHIGQEPIKLKRGSFDINDKRYSAIVRKIMNDEIGSGEGCNFVIKRQFIAEISDYTLGSALRIFRQLVENESGAYWTFIVHTGERTFVGASPELHLSLTEGIATMNPVSGTYRYPTTGATVNDLLEFLNIDKETDELNMVVEEELKMISRFCPEGGKVIGPYLKEMSRLAHTEYFIKGRSNSDPREMLRKTLFAPTVTGSPIKNACRVIKKYEPRGRAYYSGVAALIGNDAMGNPSLDSTILIRTADIDNQGTARIGVGATIVRHSDPEMEALETRAKATAMLNAMNIGVTTNV